MEVSPPGCIILVSLENVNVILSGKAFFCKDIQFPGYKV
jgi:hypothetical protein